MALEIRQLRAICAIAEAGSLSQAAAALGVSQPSLTSL
ncbi:LysR family transcriptional regulator [Amycolatopsis sp. WQ 127309]|nr:LysR family transcriptional regulator [Amycolatopsis sp. WQ 127309]UOZ03556.1 LysR family transcriptional regulator [Amycolatopsis sp. WQ 127309]